MEYLKNTYENIRQRIVDFVQSNPRRAAIIGGAIFLLLLSFVIRVPQPHVSLAGEALFEHGPSWFTNSLLTTILVDIFLIVLAFQTTRNMSLIPRGLQNFMEIIVEYFYDLSESIAGRAASQYFPWAMTLFLFLVISNWSGLLPLVGSLGVIHGDLHLEEAVEEEHGFVLDNQLAMSDGALVLVEAAAEEEGHTTFVPVFRAPSADLSTTFALAIATMFMVQVYGYRALGPAYFKKFFNTAGEGSQKGVNIFVSVLELISEVARVLTFSFRLFGNIFAGEVVLATMAFLVTFLVPLPFYFLEVAVSVIQAFVFAILALIFFSMSTVSHEHDGEHH